MDTRYVEVAVPLPVSGTFTYSVPDELAERAVLGSRVLVPFGRRRVTGFVVGDTGDPEIESIKPIIDVLDIGPVVDERMLELTRWVADYYLASWGEVLRAALPPGINLESRRALRITEDGRQALEEDRDLPETQQKLLEAAVERDRISLMHALRLAGIPRGRHGDVDALVRVGLLELFEELRGSTRAGGRQAVVRLAVSPEEARKRGEGLASRAPKQARALRLLADADGSELTPAELREAGVGTGSVSGLVEKGLVERAERSDPDVSTGGEGWDLREEGPLKPEQAEALGLIRTHMSARRFGVVLIHGVTGSGKTRVYSEAVRTAVDEGRSAIVLVPEIALTPQMVQRLRMEFGDRVAVVHSGLTRTQRYDTWRAVREGRYPIVVGPRSAVFAPVPDLGVIVVDEEHEGTYKQGESPRYHARDVAVMRAKLDEAVVVLGTATPSMETYQNAREGKYDLVELPTRIDAGPLPEVELIDMRHEQPVDTEGAFSARLRDEVARTIDEGRQVILFLNRRGYASFLQCMDCGHTLRCGDCHVSLTYHSVGRRLRCHYCGTSSRAPTSCPECGSANLRFGAPGTQRVERSVRELFPDAVTERMDQDTTSRPGAHWRILRAFAERRTDVLLGTQMIAKGLDFPGVGLVGVVAADVGLNLPDFRAGERTFQLLTQVAGRTGRWGESGRVVVQTYRPEHYTIELARAQSFTPFYERESEERRGMGLGYPPFSRLVSILVRGRRAEQVTQAAATLAEFLDAGATTMDEPRPEVLGPAPAPLERLKGSYRWHVLVRGRGGAARALVAAALRQIGSLKLPSSVSVAVDVDPVDLL
ncbi:MAG: primosomal protein N' [Candidatus Eisenbacteria bacterium]|nr:primosomal protein N' [Candidatus Eisenbacteria bacterium]